MSKKSGQRVVSCGVKKEPITRRIQIPYVLFAVVEVFLDWLIDYLTAITLSELYGKNKISRKVIFSSDRHLITVAVE